MSRQPYSSKLMHIPSDKPYNTNGPNHTTPLDQDYKRKKKSPKSILSEESAYESTTTQERRSAQDKIQKQETKRQAVRTQKSSNVYKPVMGSPIYMTVLHGHQRSTTPY